MGIYGNLWELMGTYGNLFELMGTYGNFVRENLWELMGTSCPVRPSHEVFLLEMCIRYCIKMTKMYYFYILVSDRNVYISPQILSQNCHYSILFVKDRII